ncbi:MAG: ectoine synthase [Deltaproteobacteria bacterium]|nr:ectoine synthase [Deltaproteobacteria bacterium]
MIIKRIEDIRGTDREIFSESGNWVSRRLLLKSDGMGFSFHETIIFANTETQMWYKNHLEAVYCIEGTGEVELLEGGDVIPLEPGTLYALDKHDRHIVRARDRDLRLICVFNPALVGREDHLEDGSYAMLEDEAAL